MSKIIRFPAIAMCLGFLPGTPAFAQYVERIVETVRTSDVQVLTSGPVHEAFAETIVNDPEPDLVVLQPPPPPIAEDPPDIVPEGPNMTWIPGYWAWDDDRNDYLWVSGIWRAVPLGRSFVPGFWSRVGHGYQWSSGFWLSADDTEITYLPEPPDPVETGPPPPSPSPNLIWTQGIWVWDQDRYAFRPGHWVEATPDWMWIPAHYIWSPRGYVFVDGYWDYPIEERGVLFSPVYVSPVVRTSSRFVYEPTMVIDLQVFTDHLFVRPRYSHYYFGDYYAASYIDRGIYPWFSVQARRVGYDPIYAQRRWRHRDDPDWERHVEVDYRRRQDDERQRPQRTLDVQLQLGDRAEMAVKGIIVAKTLQQMAQANQNRFRTVSQPEREQNVQKARVASKTSQERKAVESLDDRDGAEPVKPTAPVRAKTPPPVATAKKEAPPSKAPAPKKPEAATVDRSVEAKPKPKVEKKTSQPSTPAKPDAPPSDRPAATPPSTAPKPASPATPPPPSAAKPVTPPAPKDEPKPATPPVRYSPPPKEEPKPPPVKYSPPPKPVPPPAPAKPVTPPDKPDDQASKGNQPAPPPNAKGAEKSSSGKSQKKDKDKNDNDDKDKKDKDDH